MVPRHQSLVTRHLVAPSRFPEQCTNNIPGLGIDVLERGVVLHLLPAPPEFVCDRLLRQLTAIIFSASNEA
jgi:hypothetical protein